MPKLQLPFEPIRREVYSSDELFARFDLGDPSSWATTPDFAAYRYFVREGRTAPTNPYSGMMQALHDSAITQATLEIVSQRRVVAIMGGHKLARNAPAYAAVADLARRLTRSGYLVCSGGGPGAMEASHLGAALAPHADNDLSTCLGKLTDQPIVPALSGIVDGAGQVDARLVEAAHQWFAPAFEIHSGLVNRGESLAIPTWHYGHEPTTPLASHIAKYFQNSIREDGLLALGSHGVVFAEGKAGTIQEIFQDATQNYYRSFSHFSPMVLLGVKYWTETFPVVPLLRALFSREDFDRYVLSTDDVTEASAFIGAFRP
jgi:predicted Rossmann-fold nucleotide-binding protein